MRVFRRGFVAALSALAVLLLGFQSAPLAHADELMTISGTLTDKNGPLGGLNVCAEPVASDQANSARRECVTSEVGTGAYTIAGLVPWQYQLVAYGDGFPATYFGLDGPTSDSSEAAILDLSVPLTDRNIVLAKPPLDVTPTPKVSGKAKVGAKLTAKPGTWTSGATLSYQWLRAGVAIPGATKVTYKVQRADGGSKLSVRVTGTKPGFYPSAQVSAPTKSIPLSKLKSGKPKISGTAVVGGTLSAKPGKWTAGTAYAYTWLANGKAIPGATGATLLLTPIQAGQVIKVKVTGTKQGYKPKSAISKAKKVR